MAAPAGQREFRPGGRMSQSSSYGEAFGKRIDAQSSSFVSRALRKSTIAVTQLRYENPQFTLSTPPAYEDAFMLGLYLTDCPRYEYWEDGRAAPVAPIRAGETIVYDIKRRPAFHRNHRFHSVHFYFSRGALDAIADEADAPPIEELRYRPGVAHDDPVVRHLAAGLLPFFDAPEQVSRLFMDHVMLAIGLHVACRYGGMSRIGQPVRGGLAPWQEARAKEILAGDLGADVPLACVAQECGLSSRHFSRAFRDSVGVSPHQWLIRQRVERAKGLLRNAQLSLADVAVASGFADQSHFTRFFTGIVGVSPGVWRRRFRI